MGPSGVVLCFRPQAMDLHALAHFHQCEIIAFDLTQPASYGYGVGQPRHINRVFLCFSGRHYDVIAFEHYTRSMWAGSSGDEAKHKEFFSVADAQAVDMARDLVESLHRDYLKREKNVVLPRSVPIRWTHQFTDDLGSSSSSSSSEVPRGTSVSAAASSGRGPASAPVPALAASTVRDQPSEPPRERKSAGPDTVTDLTHLVHGHHGGSVLNECVLPRWHWMAGADPSSLFVGGVFSRWVAGRCTAPGRRGRLIGTITGIDILSAHQCPEYRGPELEPKPVPAAKAARSLGRRLRGRCGRRGAG